MADDRMRFSALAAFVAVSAVISGACVEIVSAGRYVEREDKHFAVNGKPHVALSTFDGSIEIRSSERHEVAVTIERRGYSKRAAAAIEVHTEQTGDLITVDVRLPRTHRLFGFGFGNGTSARLIVTVPGSTDVRARSGDGSIDIQRVTGTLDLWSGDGSIHGRDLGGEVKARTGDGSIRLEQLDGALDVDTGDGSIVASGKLTSVLARSGDGRVTIRAAEGSAPTADWDIKTGDGSVVLEVPEGFSGELDAHTGDGSIRVNAIPLSNVSGPVSKNTVRGRLGDGGHVVRVRTGDGSITLNRS
jgi:DUF4097 and DUF4098 domain-containing protein YvlB